MENALEEKIPKPTRRFQFVSHGFMNASRFHARRRIMLASRIYAFKNPSLCTSKTKSELKETHRIRGRTRSCLSESIKIGLGPGDKSCTRQDKMLLRLLEGSYPSPLRPIENTVSLRPFATSTGTFSSDVPFWLGY